MLIDRQNTFSNEQAVTADAISTNVIDLGPLGGATANTNRDIGAGKQLYLHSVVTTAFTTGDAGTLTVTLESDSAVGLDSSATVHLTAASAVAAATMVAGYWLAKGIPLPAGAYERYLGLRYTTNTGDFTAGKVTSWISENRYDDRTYESGFTSGVN